LFHERERNWIFPSVKTVHSKAILLVNPVVGWVEGGVVQTKSLINLSPETQRLLLFHYELLGFGRANRAVKNRLILRPQPNLRVPFFELANSIKSEPPYTCISYN